MQVRRSRWRLLLAPLLEAAQDAGGRLHRRLGHEDLLEAPLERRVFLDVLPVLVQRRRADAAQLTARERWLEQIAGVHRAVRLPGPDDGVDLVDEEDDCAVRLGHLVQHRLEPLLELASVLCARDERAHVQREQPAAAQALGHVSRGDALREALGDRRLAHTRLAEQNRVVLGAPREDGHRAANLVVAADDRVEPPSLCLRREIARVLLQRLVGGLGVL
mmetsp:Transcript_3085/g.8871  ORF Transcript_3085/g.8871 Transcript_3085/m.8871 type:complete len:219 (-) Transcript_3085:567-1223(-)